MNREIKFRAWIGEKMTNAIRLEAAHGIRLVSSSDLTPHSMSDDKVIFMQFTGLLDKNGKEIYEGDIIDDGKSKMAIKFMNGRFIYDDDTYEEGIGDDLVIWADHGKVIGNIYENPELLSPNQ